MSGRVLRGTANAPLVATREYTFRFVTREGDEGDRYELEVPWGMRHPTDDYGAAMSAEQVRFVHRFAARYGGAATHIGWEFDDDEGARRCEAALHATLQAVADVPPRAIERFEIDGRRARPCDAEVVPAFVALVASVAGVDAARFERTVFEIEGTHERHVRPTRTERWELDRLWVVLHAVGIESGHGVVGEHAKLAAEGMPPGVEVEGRTRIDMRSGGWVELEVSGVHDAAAWVRTAIERVRGARPS